MIRRLVRDLDIPVQIEVCPTVREPGRARAVEPQRALTPASGDRATALHRALDACSERSTPASATPPPHRARALAELARAEIEPEYFELVAADTLHADRPDRRRCRSPSSPRGSGATRLIDNERRSIQRRPQQRNTHHEVATPTGRQPPLKEAKPMSATPASPVPQSLAPAADDAADAGREEAPRRADRDGHRLRLPGAQVAEAAGVDIVLVGDSGAMTVLGYPSTVPVSTDEMLMLAPAVRRGLRTPFLVGDLPFGSYEESDEQAIATALRFVKEAGCDAVKLERGDDTTVAARPRDRAAPGSR